MSPDEYLPTQRGALIAWHLARGERLTTVEIARLSGVTYDGARRLMEKLSAALPIYQDDCGTWTLLFPFRIN